ncbi:MAG: DUF1622 domain-containing protein [Woeseia sp.]
MSDAIKLIAEWCAALVEALGISIITGIAVYTVLYAAIQLLKKETTEAIFLKVRQRLGRGILLGLEFLVAADIIHTVAVELTFNTVGTLAIIVLIRTFLSFSLEAELTGSWPWQGRNKRST